MAGATRPPSIPAPDREFPSRRVPKKDADLSLNLKWSSTARFIDGPRATAVIDSLFLKPVYLGSEFTQLKTLYGAGLEPDDCVAALSVADDQRQRLSGALLDAKVIGDWMTDQVCAADVAATVIDNRHLTELYLVTTGACNFACSHCLSGSDNTHTSFFKSAMDERTALRAVEMFASVMDPGRANRVVFYGGEPLMRWPLMQCVMDEVRAHPNFGRGPGQIHTKLITNGALMTHERAAELGRNQAEVVLSFDGPDSITQLSRPSRSKVAYPQLETICEMLKDHGVEPSLSVTVTEATLANIDRVLAWVSEEVTVPVVFLIVKQQEDLLYNDVFAERASEAMIDAYRRILAAGGEEQRLNGMIDSMRANFPNVQSCFAQGAQQIVVDQNGRVGVCQGFLEDGKFFDVNIWQPGLEETLFDLPAMRHWQGRLPLNIEPCRHCASVGICGGGCPASASKGGKTVYNIDLGHCRTTKKVLPFLLWEVLNVAAMRRRFDLPDYASFGLD